MASKSPIITKTTINMMKKHSSSILFLLLTGLFLASCQKDEDSTVPPAPIPPPVLVDGGSISSINLYCLEKNREPPLEIWYNYFPKTKIIEDYSNIQLCVMVDTDIPLRESEDSVEMSAINKMEANYHRERISTVLNISKDDAYYIDKGYILDGYLTAYVNGEVTLTCDKTLFGETPGTNLSKYFFILGGAAFVPIGIENPEMHYFDDASSVMMNDNFVDEAWLYHGYAMELNTIPLEQYDSLTLHLSIPMTIEHVRDYMMSTYRGDSIGPRFTDQIFEADCLIKFKWD